MLILAWGAPPIPMREAGEGSGAHVCNVTDVHAVHHIVECIDKLGGDGGDSQNQKQMAYRLLPQVNLS